jgi:hypothetical protein
MKLKDKKLEKAVDMFAREMKKRLAVKEDIGWNSWKEVDMPAAIRICGSKMLTVRASDGPIKEIIKHEVDIANFMMLLWYQDRYK